MNPLKTLNAGVTALEKSNETSNSNSTNPTSLVTLPSITTPSTPEVRIIQNFCLVWLDSSFDEVNNNDSRNTITKLRQVINAVKKFTDVDECIDFITSIEDENVLMICSEELVPTTVPMIHDMAQLNGIYIFCQDEVRHEQWATEWRKVKGVYTDITPICKALKQAAQDCDHNSVSISFVKSTDGASKENLDTLDPSFMYTQILKEILLTIDFEQVHIDDFLTYCREQFTGNTIELRNIEKIETEYRHHQPIWWYTYQCFFYSMLNRALRLMEVDLIIKMGFFVRDLHNHIVTLHTEQYSGHHHSKLLTVYRGQGLSQTDFDQLIRTKGGLMSFNNFLSTSLDRVVSLAFAESNQHNPDLIGVLFEITIDPSIRSFLFANAKNVSYYQSEEEILFSMHSIFRIGQVKQIDKNDRLWQVDLTLTGDNDPQLQALTERMREETFSGHKGWYRLGELMIKLGQFNKAQQVYDALISQTSDDNDKAFIYHGLGCVADNQGEYDVAITFYGQAIEIYETRCPNDYALANSYGSIGLVYDNMGEYSKALSYYEQALEIKQKTLPANHPSLATLYNNIGNVYKNMGEYSKALSYLERALNIWQRSLPPNHPNIKTVENSIEIVKKKL